MHPVNVAVIECDKIIEGVSSRNPKQVVDPRDDGHPTPIVLLVLLDILDDGPKTFTRVAYFHKISWFDGFCEGFIVIERVRVPLVHFLGVHPLVHVCHGRWVLHCVFDFRLSSKPGRISISIPTKFNFIRVLHLKQKKK